jgi:hypothetical protein
MTTTVSDAFRVLSKNTLFGTSNFFVLNLGPVLGGIRFRPSATPCLYFVLRAAAWHEIPGRENSPPDCFLIRPSNPTEQLANTKTSTLLGCLFLCWRRGWDSNPREVSLKLISSQPRYDRFDTSPYECPVVPQKSKVL